MPRTRRVIPGRTVSHFFIRSALAAANGAGRFEHLLIVENTTIFAHRAELTSHVASLNTEYDGSAADKSSWVVEVKVIGRMPKQARSDVIVSDPNVDPAIQTTALRCRRDVYQRWNNFGIIPAIDVTAKA